MTVAEPDKSYPLVSAFGAAASAAAGPLELDRARLQARLEAAWSTSRQAWPDLEVPAEQFAAHLGGITGASPDPVAAIDELVLPDLYLACASLRGDERALALLENHAFGDIQTAAAALRASETELEEVRQIVRTLLFVTDGDRTASIGEFAGRGTLRGWIRVIATREFLRLRRKTSRELPLEEYILNDLESHGDPAMERLKQSYRSEVADALREAIDLLDVRDRLLLRYQVCERLNIDALAAIYQVHRATAARWLVKARTALLELTKERLAIRLSVEPGETESILRLVHSQLDVSLERRLREEP